MVVKQIVSKLIPKQVRRNIRFQLQLRDVRAKQLKAKAVVRKKETIRVAFFVVHGSVWKYQLLYEYMEAHPRFYPQVFICPYTNADDLVMKETLRSAYELFVKKGYNVQNTLKQDGSWLDIKLHFKPDLIFFTNPHNLTRPEYLITNYLDKLTCYSPYNFGNCHLLNMFHNQDFHNFLWKLFTETEVHQQFSQKYARNKGVNTLVTGFPGTDSFLQRGNSTQNNPWKTTSAKRIIWAPHHTIDDNKAVLSYSSFLNYAHFFHQLLEKYKGQIEIAFKPHPILKENLYLHDDWGVEKTNNYYNKWNLFDNGFLAEADYIDLFKTSDAMIHDSGSFLIEYLYTENPVLRTDVDDHVRDRINAFGLMAYDVHYIARNKQQVEGFITKLIAEDDVKLQDRKRFKEEWLVPPNGKLASENIMDFLTSELV